MALTIINPVTYLTELVRVDKGGLCQSQNNTKCMEDCYCYYCCTSSYLKETAMLPP